MKKVQKMKTLALLFLASAFLFPSCKKLFIDSGDLVTQEREIDSEFTAIEVEGAVDLFLNTEENGDMLKIEAGEKLLPYIRSEVYENELHLYVDANSFNNTRVKMYLSKTMIDKIVNKGSGDLEAQNLEGDSFTLIQSGSGDSNVVIGERSSVTINDQGSGDVRVTGNTLLLSTNSSGSGDGNLRQLEAKSANINMSGSGDVLVTVTQSLTAQMNGSGNLKYWGNPEEVNIQENGSGNATSQE